MSASGSKKSIFKPASSKISLLGDASTEKENFHKPSKNFKLDIAMLKGKNFYKLKW